MQFFATAATLVVAVIGSVSAMPSYASGECSTGATHCCNASEPASSEKGKTIVGALGLNVPTSSSLGLECTPINMLALGGSQQCNQMPMCCNGNTYGSLAVGCMPVNIIA